MKRRNIILYPSDEGVVVRVIDVYPEPHQRVETFERIVRYSRPLDLRNPDEVRTLVRDAWRRAYILVEKLQKGEEE